MKMAKVNYNFDEALIGVDEIPAPETGGMPSGPSESDKPFLDFVARTLRERGSGGMPFDTPKERNMANYRIGRWIRKEHDVPVRTFNRRLDDKHWLFWKLEDDSAFDDESSESGASSDDDAQRPDSESEGGVFFNGEEDVSRW